MKTAKKRKFEYYLNDSRKESAFLRLRLLVKDALSLCNQNSLAFMQCFDFDLIDEESFKRVIMYAVRNFVKINTDVAMNLCIIYPTTYDFTYDDKVHSFIADIILLHDKLVSRNLMAPMHSIDDARRIVAKKGPVKSKGRRLEDDDVNEEDAGRAECSSGIFSSSFSEFGMACLENASKVEAAPANSPFIEVDLESLDDISDSAMLDVLDDISDSTMLDVEVSQILNSKRDQWRPWYLG